MGKIARNLEEAKKHALNQVEDAMHAEYVKSFTDGSMEAHVHSQRAWIRDKGPMVECVSILKARRHVVLSQTFAYLLPFPYRISGSSKHIAILMVLGANGRDSLVGDLCLWMSTGC